MTQYNTASPDSTQTDTATDKHTDTLSDKHTDSLNFQKTKTEPCDSLLEFCKTKTDSCDNLDELAELVSSQTDSFDFCKPNTAAFEKFGTYRDRQKDIISSARNSPCKPKAGYDGTRSSRQVGVKYKRHDSPVSTLDEVYKTTRNS